MSVSPDAFLSCEFARGAAREGRGRGVRIAIIDSGVETGHPELAGLQLADDVQIVAEGGRMVARNGEGEDLYGHGTAVASVIRRLAPEAELGSFRVLDAELRSRTAVIREGVRQAIDRGYNILNCSFGCGIREHIFHYKEWTDEAFLNGVHVVAACNNDDCGKPEWPGHLSSVVTVNMAPLDDDLELLYRSGHLVAFGARGVNLRVPWNRGQFKQVTGSSFAAPRVSAMLARILSVVPMLTPAEAKAVLQRVASPWVEPPNLPIPRSRGLA